MRETDVLVVGAGVAGVAATLAASAAGARVMLVDEFGAAGGWLRWCIAAQPPVSNDVAGGRGDEIAAQLAGLLRGAGVDITHGVAWGLFEDNLVGVVADNVSMQVSAASVIVASGSTDIVTPFSGWELTGVMTARAALRSLHEWRVLPGEQVLVLGAGDAAANLAEAFSLAGVGVTRADAADVVGGNGRVAWAEADGQRLDIDCVVIAEGRQPDPELALQALCDARFSELDQSFVPRRSDTLETSVRCVYVVGDAAGSCSTAEAFAEGRLAGLAAVGDDVAGAQAALARVRSAERADECARMGPPTAATA
jgi:pyruvate/2-oxoglutarate dehydrogenase complex dihydrolipoamide dehydrogenase (E3) component